MFRGLYTATSGMMANERKQQYLTNNLTNASTPGFKQDQATLRSFPEYLLKERNNNTSTRKDPVIGSLSNGVYTQEGIPLFRMGALQETGKLTDLAIVDDTLPIDEETGKKGTSLFAVRKEDNSLRYTRNGNFSLNKEGFLVTSEGYNVLNQNLEPIQLSNDSFSLTDETIIEKNGNEQRIWIGYTGDPAKLSQEGNGVFRWGGPENEAPRSILTTNLSNYSLKQGFLEGSNVDTSSTMTDMLNTYRMYEANQKVIQTYDQSIDKTVNEIGRVY